MFILNLNEIPKGQPPESLNGSWLTILEAADRLHLKQICDMMRDLTMTAKIILPSYHIICLFSHIRCQGERSVLV